MNWSREELLNNLDDIIKFFKNVSNTYKVNKLVHNCKVVKDFNSKFPNLFTLGEINYWYKNFDSLKPEVFYCGVCGKSVKYLNFKYNKYCSRKCAANSEEYHGSLHRYKSCVADLVYWNRKNLTKEFPKLKRVIKSLRAKYGNIKLILPKTKLYREFITYYSNLFNASEFSYWYRNIDTLDISILYCKHCGNRVKFQGYYPQFCCSSCVHKSKLPIQKAIQTHLRNYGVMWATQNRKVLDKIESTNMQRYGCKNPLQNKNILAKMKATNLQRYGVEDVNQNKQIRERSKETCNILYGFDFYSQSEDFKERMSSTKRKNGTFNTSQPEEDMYKLLCKSFGKRNVLRQYHSEVYPFNCDFYLPKFDLYMEYNGSWTHGGEPYNSRKIKHRNILSTWNSKNNSYYDLAIKVWTVKDPEKRRVAKQNELRHIEFWNLDQVQNWVSKYGKAKRFSKGMLI